MPVNTVMKRWERAVCRKIMTEMGMQSNDNADFFFYILTAQTGGCHQLVIKSPETPLSPWNVPHSPTWHSRPLLPSSLLSPILLFHTVMQEHRPSRHSLIIFSGFLFTCFQSSSFLCWRWSIPKSPLCLAQKRPSQRHLHPILDICEWYFRRWYISLYPCRCDSIKDLEMGRQFWIIQVGPKFNHRCPYKRRQR